MRLGLWARRRPKVWIGASVVLLVIAGGLAAVAIDAVERARLDGRVFDAPTRFYARPIVLEPGRRVRRDRVERHLRRLGYRPARARDVAAGEYALDAWRWVIGRRAFRHYDQLDPGGLTVVEFSYDDRIYGLWDGDGRPLRFAALEPQVIRADYGPPGEDRLPARVEDIPQHVVDAILAIEDQRFHEHRGLDFRRIVGAALANLRARGIVEGASTITQQLAKNLFLSSRRSPVRKVREIAMAVVLEARHTKEEILEAYLNQVYLGQDGALGIHGVARAAQHYFGKDVSQLALGDAALLAGIIRGPSLYSPYRHPEAATRRRNLVLDVMRARAIVSDTAYRSARSAPLGLRRQPERARRGRYFVDFVARRLGVEHGPDVLHRGLAVFTTLDMDLQRAAEDAVRDGLARLERDVPALNRDRGTVQAALVALDPRTGEVLAMTGGRDYGRSQFNRATHARRQPGSAFKPVVAMAALSSRAFTLASRLDDEPMVVETPAGLWRPGNYDRRFRGAVSLREALERSLNVPFARLGMALGPERIVETARALGIESRLRAVPSIALGSNEVTPLEMARAFGVFAAGGYRARLGTTLGVVDRTGAILERAAFTGDYVYGEAESYLVTSALRGAVERGTGRALRAHGYWGPVAAKSGTTNDYRDAWFIGYTPTLAVAVWVGFDDGRSIGLPGSRAALPIFARFLVGAHGRYGDVEFSRPSGLEVAEVDRETGRAGYGCRGEPELFLRGTVPEGACGRWRSWRRYDRRSPSVRVVPRSEPWRRTRRGRN